MEARESQDTFNDIADIIDFHPKVFAQDNWGTGLTLERFRDSNGVEEDVLHVYDESTDDKLSFEIGNNIGELSKCGTACCVAGWAALLEGWHPTITEFNRGEYSETYDAFRKKLDSEETPMVAEYIHNAEHKIFELEYGFVASSPGVRNEGWGWHQAEEWENGVLVLEDGVTEVGRVDIIAQKILGLTAKEASILFESSQPWIGDDLRMMGKGEDIASLNKSNSVDPEDPRSQYGTDGCEEEIF